MRIHKVLKNTTIHVAMWLLYVTFAIFVYGYHAGQSAMTGYVYETSISFAISATIFYIHASYLLPAYFDRGRYLLYAAMLILFLCYNFSVRYFLFFILYPFVFHNDCSIVGYTFFELCLIFTWQWVTFMLFSAGYWLALKRIRLEKIARAQDQVLAHQQQLQLEVAALKAQINPHFLFNTLDSFRIESEELLPAMSHSITALVEVMRYSIGKPDEDGLIPISKEVNAIESLVNIFRRRFPYMHLEYHIGIIADCAFRIPPLVLLSFVENAFKHGIYTDPTRKLRIDLKVTENDLSFFAYNKKGNKTKSESHGIGMKYIVRLLENHFNGRYELKINDNDMDYSVSLKISP